MTPRHDTYPFITPTNFNLSGKHVLITGASRGLGRAAAVAYGQGGASAIAVAARGSLDAVEKEVLEAAAKAGRDVPRILKINLDVGDLQSVEKAAATVFEQFGRLDILINNAAIIERFLPVQEGDPQDWAKVIDIDIKGPYYVTRAFLPLLLKKGDKTIINISSLAAFLTMPGASAYIQAKLALIKFSEVLQAEYQDQGILVYAVHPGAVITDMSMSGKKAFSFCWVLPSYNDAGANCSLQLLMR